MSSVRAFAFAVLAAALAACSPQAAHAPVDPQLDALLTQLAAAPDDAAAQTIESRIWARLADSGTPTVNVLLERANAAEEAGENDLALRFLDQASDLAPNYAEPWNRRASLAYKAEDYSGAINAIQETLKRE